MINGDGSFHVRADLGYFVYSANKRAVNVIGVLASAAETGQPSLTAAAIS
jgi:hypothetical protein